MQVYPDANIAQAGGRIAAIRVSYAHLVQTFGEPNAPAEQLDPDKVSAEWLLATSEGPARVYNWLPDTGYQPAETTTCWHIGGARTEVVSPIAQALNVSAHIYWWDPQQKQIIDTTVSFGQRF
ncbi:MULTISPECIES: hypothetical protein [Mycobacterium]|uniref:hypothetical protein n=1 Tax=Mycobacterium TaxID=1763 RepID=UPI0005EF6602|nr:MULTISPECIES: hypothetical protein [Mycobacterium]MCV7034838.1 hypothetical protein [Mycobacterium heckeshornense]